MTFEKIIHFRRCHVCGGVNFRVDGSVEHCEHCNKKLARFCFFDEQAMDALSADKISTSRRSDRIPPIYGLSSYW